MIPFQREGGEQRAGPEKAGHTDPRGRAEKFDRRTRMNIKTTIGDMACLIYDGCDRSKISKDNPLNTMDRKAYSDYITEVNRKRWASGEVQKEFLYAGSETRAALSEAEIRALANKYDPHSMDNDTFDAFLDDLESMGAISKYEKGVLGYRGMADLGYFNEGGKLIDCTEGIWSYPGTPENLPLRNREEADGDIYRWLTERAKWERHLSTNDPEVQKAVEDYEQLHLVLGKIVSRMQVCRTENTPKTADAAKNDKAAKAAEKAALREQIADPNSDFYANMFAQMKANVERTREDEEQQDIVEALGAVLEALSGKEDVSGNKASVNKAATDLTQKIGDRIARLKREDPEDPEIVKLESMLQRLQEMGIYIDIGETDDIFTDEEDNFETLTQLLTRRQKEEAISNISLEKRGEEQQ